MRNAMNPFWFVVKMGGMALVTYAGLAFLVRKFNPEPSDIVAGIVHFKKGADEFHKGMSAILFGAQEPASLETEKQRRESARIAIE